jgi:hypothetical protein
MDNSECINGWVELLHCKYTLKTYNQAATFINPINLKTFTESHYDVVGSALPLCEYASAFEIYQQYAVEQDPEFHIPRPFRDYDAINLCVNDAVFGKKITTLIMVPKNAHTGTKYREQNVQYHPNFPHCLMIRKTPFKSLLMQKK